MKEKLNWRRK